MKAKIFSLFLPFVLSLVSGIFLVLIFPNYDLAWLAWIGLVPLLIAISGRRPKYGFLLALLCSFIFFPGVFYWMLGVAGYRLNHHVILGLYLGSYLGLFGLAFCFISKRRSTTAALFSAPFIWISLEYLRSNLSFLAFPWALLGHSQYQHLPIIQFASITGTYGISFLIVLVNATVAAIILAYAPGINRFIPSDADLPSKKGTILMTASTLVLAGLALLYGQITLSAPIAEAGIKMSVVQANIEQQKKWDPKQANSIMQTYADLSSAAAQDQPAIIIWPEASTPGFVLKRRNLQRQMTALIRQTKTHYLIGSSEYPKFSRVPPHLRKVGNTAVFFSPNARVLGQYLKIRLVPFKEYVPYEGIIPWPQFIVPEGKNSFGAPGEERMLFELDGAKFGVLICWETLFPELFREFVKDGANFIVNISSEGWFGETAFPYQFLTINLFRAVENRVAIARAANTGVSCFIDPYGRITGRVMKNNKDLSVRGFLTREISPSYEKTFYTRYGDIFTYAAIIVSILMIALSFFKIRKH